MKSWTGTKIGFTIIGTMIGAGFASGREVWEFFASYGQKSAPGLLLAIGLFAVCSFTIMYIGVEVKADHYLQILQELMGKKIAVLFDSLILFYLFSVSVVMFAGSGATFSQWNASYVAGVLVMAVAVYIVLLFDINGLMSMNTVIIPILTSVLIYVCLQYLLGSDEPLDVRPFASEESVWPSAVIYSALNVIPLMAVLSTLNTQIRTRKDIWVATLVSTVGLGAVAILLNRALLYVGDEIHLYEIPLFSLLKLYPIAMIAVVTVILWMAIYTTAVSCVHGIMFRMSRMVRLSRPWLALILVLVMIPLSQLGFSVLIKYLYPIYGMLNLFLLGLLILYPISKRE